ncbi:MAG: TonB family protein, partial [Bryobacterales bacterium]|nr:TonB family protein [Bryobacterales bacterium]
MIVRFEPGIQINQEKLYRPAPWLISLGVHVAVAALLMFSSHTPGRTPSAYDQLLKGKEAQIIYYKFKDKLPDVKPVKSADRRPPKATVRIPKQQIVSSPKKAPKGIQTVWQPVPDIIKQDVPAPNILAVKAPEMPRPQPKKFVPPSDAPKVARDVPKPQLPDAPAQLALNTKPNVMDNLGVPALKTANRPRFTVPEARSRAVAQTPQVEAPPTLASAPSASSPDAPLQSALAELPQSKLNVAVVGLNPSDKNAIPHGSRATEFAAGPKLNPDGGTGGDKGAALTVPDLFVKGGGSEAKPTLMARMNAAPTSAEALRGMSKYSSPGREEPSNGHPAARRVASAPNSRFDGREVYSMAIQMPNITSYSGSWLMWYASHTMSGIQQAPISPPVPRRKVDPKYIATAAEERIEGRVQLMCVINGAGKVDHVEL